MLLMLSGKQAQQMAKPDDSWIMMESQNGKYANKNWWNDTRNDQAWLWPLWQITFCALQTMNDCSVDLDQLLSFCLHRKIFIHDTYCAYSKMQTASQVAISPYPYKCKYIHKIYKIGIYWNYGDRCTRCTRVEANRLLFCI